MKVREYSLDDWWKDITILLTKVVIHSAIEFAARFYIIECSPGPEFNQRCVQPLQLRAKRAVLTISLTAHHSSPRNVVASSFRPGWAVRPVAIAVREAMLAKQQVLAEWLGQPPNYHCQRRQHIQLEKYGFKKLNMEKLPNRTLPN